MLRDLGPLPGDKLDHTIWDLDTWTPRSRRGGDPEPHPAAGRPRRRRHADQGLTSSRSATWSTPSPRSSSRSTPNGQPIVEGTRAAGDQVQGGGDPEPDGARGHRARHRPQNWSRRRHRLLLQDLHPRRLPDLAVRAHDPPPALPLPPVDVRPHRHRQGASSARPRGRCRSCRSRSTTRATWSPSATSPNPSDRASGSVADHVPRHEQDRRAPTATSRDGPEAEQGRRRPPSWADDRLGLGHADAKNLPQGLPRPLVVHARRDRAVELRRPAADRRVPDASGSRRAWSRSSTTAPTRRCAASRCPRPTPRRCDISFDVRGGLLMRQMHHWAALLFIAAMIVHMIRVFFTGAFRKPRELNWVIGVAAAAARHRSRASPATRCPTTCSPAPACGSPTGFMQGDPGGRHLHVVLPLRRRVPGRRDHPAALHRPRAADPGHPARR